MSKRERRSSQRRTKTTLTELYYDIVIKWNDIIFRQRVVKLCVLSFRKLLVRFKALWFRFLLVPSALLCLVFNVAKWQFHQTMWFGVSSATAFAAAAWIFFMQGEEKRETQYISYEATAFQFGRCNDFSHNNRFEANACSNGKWKQFLWNLNRFKPPTHTHTRPYVIASR